VKTYAGARIEDQLTSLLSASIEKEHAKTDFHSCHQVAMKYKDGPRDVRCNILFSPNEEGSSESSTPLAMVEVGRHHLEWWQTFDQNVKYVSCLGSDRNQANSRLGFCKPLLFAVITIEGEDTPPLQVKLGVFLCYRNDFKEGDFRMIDSSFTFCHQRPGPAGSFKSFWTAAQGDVLFQTLESEEC
jgi:hypothetical protein